MPAPYPCTTPGCDNRHALDAERCFQCGTKLTPEGLKAAKRKEDRWALIKIASFLALAGVTYAWFNAGTPGSEWVASKFTSLLNR